MQNAQAKGLEPPLRLSGGFSPAIPPWLCWWPRWCCGHWESPGDFRSCSLRDVRYLAVSATRSQGFSPKSGLSVFKKDLFPAASSQGCGVCKVRDESWRFCCGVILGVTRHLCLGAGTWQGAGSCLHAGSTTGCSSWTPGSLPRGPALPLYGGCEILVLGCVAEGRRGSKV